jgi:hypothetical protein
MGKKQERWRRVIGRLIKWFLSLFKDKVKEIEREAKKEVNKVDNGKPMSDFINDQLRDN